MPNIRPKLRSFAIVCGILLPLGLIAPSQTDAASVPAIIHVSSSTCSSPGDGSLTNPYCTVQQAADVVVAGQTVQVNGGTGYAAFTLTHSGTPSQPITFIGVGTLPMLTAATLDGVHDVDLSHMGFQTNNAASVIVENSHDVTVDHVTVYDEQITSAPHGIDVTGGSYDVTVSRSSISLGAVLVNSGSHDVTVTTNEFGYTFDTAIAVNDADNVDVTSNSIAGDCGSGITVAAASATIENNVLDERGTSATCPAAPQSAITVAADSVAGVTADYNAVGTLPSRTAYSWGGTTYPTAAAFATATGQGTHDIGLGPSGINVDEGSPYIDSANVNAPGELSSDYFGNPRVDDPTVANTGTGSGFYDRGDREFEDPLNGLDSLSPTSGLAPLTSAMTISGISSPWSLPVKATVDFGDGSAPVTTTGGTIPHTFTVPGYYMVNTTFTDSLGYTTPTSTYPVLVGTPSVQPAHIVPGLDVSGAAVIGGGVTFGIPAADPSEIDKITLNFGDGTSQDLGGLATAFTHQYANTGVYQAGITTFDAFGRQSQSSGTAVSGDVYEPLTTGPIRDYDSRTTGQQIPARSVLRLSLAQLNAGSTGVDAVQLGVTVTGAKAAGYVSVYPDGASAPTSSILNFVAGRATANEVPAVAGANTFVDFYNGSSGPIDLIVDTFGRQARTTPGATYVPAGPTRILDTRTTTGGLKGKVAGGGSVTLSVGGSNGVPTNAAAVVLNLATTDTTSSGYLIAYAHGQARPATSNSNWSASATVSNLVVVPVTDGKVVLYNGGAGSVDFIADLVGYYQATGSGSIYLPHAPLRLLDTRTGTSLAPGQTVKVKVAGVNGVPASGTVAAALNLTAAEATASGYLIAYPDGTSRPTASSVNYVAGTNVANMSIMPIGPDGYVDIYNAGSKPVQLLVDLNGTYFAY